MTGKKDANFGSLNGNYNFFTCALEPIRCDSYSYDFQCLLLPGNGANVGKSTYYNGKFEAYQRTYIVQSLNSGLLLRYLHKALEYNWKEYNNNKLFGSAIPYIKLANIEEYLLPIPPTAEQSRIVERLEKLEPLIEKYDALEKQATKLDSEIKDKLRKSILQYAIQGKLVPQDKNDEPASMLLERIRKEKKAELGKKYVESYIYKGDDNCYYEHVKANRVNIDDQLPFDLPNNWSWSRLRDIVYNHGQKSPKNTFCYIDIGSIDNKNQKLNEIDKIIKPENAPSRARKIVKKGDIIYSTVRPYLHNACIIDRDFLYEPIASTGFAVLSVKPGIYNDFLFKYLLSSSFDSYANNAENSKGVAYPAINDTRLYQAVIPIPPIKEQYRIADKVNKIFSLLGE